MGPLYLNTLYLHREWVLSMKAAMFSTVARTWQTKHLLSFYNDWKATAGSLSCLEGHMIQIFNTQGAALVEM